MKEDEQGGNTKKEEGWWQSHDPYSWKPIRESRSLKDIIFNRAAWLQACAFPLSSVTDATETDEQNSVKGNLKKGRPCGGLPSKPSCVKVHRKTHPVSSYYRP